MPKIFNFGIIIRMSIKRITSLGIVKVAFKLAVFCFVFGLLGTIFLFAYFAKDLPNPNNMGQREIIESTKIYDRSGEVILYDIHGEEKRTVIPYKEIPQFIKEATIAIEDDNFYHHIGLDWRGILRAAWSNITQKRISQGGSTITQQFIKNAYLGGPQSERTIVRKIKEAILSLELESKYTKDEILSFYLNQVPYGSNAYGIEAASRTFFNKSAKELTLAEGAALAALPKAPSYYSPYGSHVEELKQRKNYILDRMVQLGYLGARQAQEAKDEEIKYASQKDLKAHHFVAMVKEYLEKNYQQTYADINKAGLKVYTTLDWDLQQIAEEIVAEGVEKNQQKYSANNGALVAIDPKTGHVVALVGSKNYQEDQFNVATSPYRQPGSSFKPFAYAAAFRKGYTPETMLFDMPTNFGAGEQLYLPKNYDLQYRGPISMRNSLAQSINVTSVKTLYLAGIEETINLAHDMGISTLKNRKAYGLSLVLGGGEVKLFDETAAYGVFAAEGIKNKAAIILKIEDAQGNILEEYRPDSIRVLEAQTARQINSILSDEAARVPMFGPQSDLYLPGRSAAAKTGTTQNYSDGWTVGYTPSLVVGVWAGNNDYSQKMKPGAAGLYVAAPIWKAFMEKSYQAKEETKKEKKSTNNYFNLPIQNEEFAPPQENNPPTKPMLNGEFFSQTTVLINKKTGEAATGETPIGLIEERNYRQAHNILYYVDKDNPLGDYPKNPSQDPQFNNWEAPVLLWAQEQGCSEDICYNQTPPCQSCQNGNNSPEESINIKIISPKNNETIKKSELTISAQVKSLLKVSQVEFYFNDYLIGVDTRVPYSLTLPIVSYLDHSSEKQIIKARVYDKSLNKAEDIVEIRIE